MVQRLSAAGRPLAAYLGRGVCNVISLLVGGAASVPSRDQLRRVGRPCGGEEASFGTRVEFLSVELTHFPSTPLLCLTAVGQAGSRSTGEVC